MEDFKTRFYAHGWAETPLGIRENWPGQLSDIANFILDNPQPVFAFWGDDRTILFNGALADILGARSESFLGSCRDDFWSEIWGIADPFAENASSSDVRAIENLPLRASEPPCKVHYLTLSITALRGPGDRVVGSIVCCTDNSGSMMEMRRLKRERSAMLRLFTEAPGFIAMVSVPEHRFVFANPSYLKLVGRTELIGQTVEEALPEIVEQGFIAILDGVVASGKSFGSDRMPIEFQPTAESERQLRYINFVYVPMKDADGSVIGIFAEGHDVTQEVAAQAQVSRLNSELVHLARLSAMETMATTLAHELTQPLTAILNYAGASQRIFEQGAGSNEMSLVIAEIGKAAARAGKIISSLRTMTGRSDVKREPFNPDEVIEAAVALADIGTWSGVALKCNLAGGPWVTGDPTQIQQVLFNIIRNAREAAQGADEGQVVVNSRATEEHVVIVVEDNGPGIAPEHIKSLFEAFFSTKGDGMGVGLSISRTIIDAHGGKIWAENRPEGGARLSFTLPIAAPQSGSVFQYVESA